MGKVLEGPGMELFNKWGIKTPRHVVISSADQIDSLVESNQWMRDSRMVVKAHEAVGSRFKLGLIKIDQDIEGVKEAAAEILGKDVQGLRISQVIIAEMVPHDEEYYLAAKSVREGAEILMARFGGIEVEENWEKVCRTFVEVGENPTEE